MKVIDILNKIANGEEVPKRIKINGKMYKKDNDTKIDYYYSEEDFELLLDDLHNTNELNNEIEIIEEQEAPKKIEKLDIGRIPVCSTKEQITQNKIDVMWKKMNEIIDYINKDNK